MASVVPAARREKPDPGPVPGRWQHASGAGSADGSTIRTDGGSGDPAGIRFDQTLIRHGYRWWYVDALSDDARYGITIIAFLGSVFSPYYAWSRRFGIGHPLHHCAMNVALYRASGRGAPKRWSMTERGSRSVSRDATHLRIGPSALAWDGTTLTITVDEITMPLPTRIRGTIRVHPSALTTHEAMLCATGNHRWTPLAPCAHVEVALDRPSLRWSGPGYLDGNSGDGAIETAFRHWDWCRAPRARDTAILYNALQRDGSRTDLALRVDRNGGVEQLEPPPEARLPRSRWGIRRATRADADGTAAVLRTLVDAPFYARSLLRTRLLGETVEAVHESLDCGRFANPLVQAMLPFRIPRALRPKDPR